MKKSIKRLVTLGMVSCLSVNSVVVSWADEYPASCDITVFNQETNEYADSTMVFTGIFSPDGAMRDTGNKITVGNSGLSVYGTGNVYDVYDENLTITVGEGKNIGMETPWISWGYLENGEIIETASFEVKVDPVQGWTSNEKVQLGKAYPVISPERLAKDKADGTAYSKIYALSIEAPNSLNPAKMKQLYYFFQLKENGQENVSASGWKQNESGWWYDNGNNTYPAGQWKEIEGKQYYFNESGYMLHDTVTPDGYTVGNDGVWIQ